MCEAGCGLDVTVTDGAVTHIRGDRLDVFSNGFLCPKGSTLRHLHDTRGAPRYGRGIRVGRRTSRVQGLPETFGEIPVVAMAEEIETAGEGQIRAMVCVAGNPNVISGTAVLNGIPVEVRAAG